MFGLSLDRWRGKVAVVTGASAGIGAKIAEKLVKEGLQVVGLARRVHRIEALARSLEGEKGRLHPLKTDVTEENQVVDAFEWISANLGPVHILVNNAGILQQTNLIDGDAEKWKKVLDTNIFGLCVCTREAIKIMNEHKIDGHVIHMSSIFGHYVVDVPQVNVYPATKHAVKALTEILRQELNKTGSKIKISSLSPGFVLSEIAKTNDIRWDPEFLEQLRCRPALKCEDVADAVLYILATPPHVQVHDLIMRPVGEI